MTKPQSPRVRAPNLNWRLWTVEEDAYLIAHWKAQSHLEMAAAIGRTRAGVRRHCAILNLVDNSSRWTPVQFDFLKSAYLKAGSAEIDLEALALSLGKSKSSVCIKASDLGLTRKSRPKWGDRGHPRGSLGRKCTEDEVIRMAARTKAFNDSLSPAQKAAYALKAAKTREANGTLYPARLGATWKAGWREIGGVNKFYRSRWEANYARYLQWLKETGHVVDWKHEPKTFWFDGAERGTNSYLPDFWVQERGGSVAYHEVKGWMDARSETKIKRMAKYHPTVKLIVIREKRYMEIKRKMAPLIHGWEE